MNMCPRHSFQDICRGVKFVITGVWNIPWRIGNVLKNDRVNMLRRREVTTKESDVRVKDLTNYSI